MNILLIPDKFKGSLTAKEVIAAIKKGILEFEPSSIVNHVIASDGGDGFIDAIQENNNIELIKVASVDPLGRKLHAIYGLDSENETAYIELANASGLTLLKAKERNVLKTSTYGTGLQIKHALEKGVKKIFIGLGGSATNDGGIGISSALGYKFLDNNNNELKPIGENLQFISSIIIPSKRLVDQVKFYAVNDVQNPLFGENGAAHVYGKQKGGNEQELDLLDQGLQNLHNVVKECLGLNKATVPGTGAAGGTAYGLKVFFNADFIEGAKFILEKNGEIEYLKNGEIDLIITGEGMIDDQTFHGKLVNGVANIGTKYEVPVIAICGKKQLLERDNKSLNLVDIIEIADQSKSLEYNMRNAASLIQEAVFNYFKTNY